MRSLWVVPRFGGTTVGGAERLVRALATRAMPESWDAEVATTCALDHFTWANELPSGSSTDDGITVHRFPVGGRNAHRYAVLHGRILARRAGYAEELEWFAHSVWSPDLHRFLERSWSDYDLLIFSPYLFGTTFWGAQVAPSRSVLVPCLHDEPYAYLGAVRTVMESLRGCMFNSHGEEQLARRLYRITDSGVVGMGFDAPNGAPQTAFAEPRGLGAYVLYAGRIEEGKRVEVAVDYAVRYAAERSDAPRLVLIGSGSYRPPESARNVVHYAGFVGEEERRAAYAEALALVNPSHAESLSIVLMEAWLEGTPALVASGSEVMRNHVERASGGFTFQSYEGYRDALDRLREDRELGRRAGAAGREYVLDVYGWPSVKERLQDTLERLAG